MANAIRVLLILASLLAISTAAVWAFVPRLVTSFDEGLHRHWTARARADMNSVADLVGAGKLDRAVERLDGLIDALDGVQHGDLLDPTYRDALQERVRVLQLLERHDDAVAAARAACAYDEKDLDNRLSLGALLVQREETAAEGEAVLADLFALVPEWPPAAEALASYLVEQERDDEAVDVALHFVRHVRSVQLRDWALRWNDGSGFREGHTLRGDLRYDAATDRFRFGTTLPASTQRVVAVRFDPPSYARLRLRDWSVELGSADADLVLTDAEAVDRVSGLKPRPDGSLRAKWMSRPNLVLNVPDPSVFSGPTRLELSARLETTFPPSLDRVLLRPERSAAVESRLEAEGRLADLELLRSQREDAR